MTKLLLCTAAALALLGPRSLPAQERPVAIVNARILTMEGDTIERGTLVMKGGRIEAVGADVEVPPSALVVDAAGGTLMPGLVNAYSRAGLQQTRQSANAGFRGRRGRRMRGPSRSPSRSTAANKAATKVVQSLYPRQEIFGELLQQGVTTLALTPIGQGLPGTGAVLDPAGKDLEGLTENDDAFVLVAMARNAGVKKVLKESFDKAKKVVEERNKPKPEPAAEKPKADEKAEGDKKAGEAKEAEKKTGEEPPKKEGEKEQGEQKPAEDKAPQRQPRKEEKKDPNVEVLADLLEGKRRAVLEIGSAADLLHWFDAVGDDLKLQDAVLVVPRHDSSAGTVDVVADKVAGLGCTVLLPLSLTTVPRTNHLIHPAAKLHDKGIGIGFFLGDSTLQVRQAFFRLMEMVRTGLPRDVALRGVTSVPARCLGMADQVGSLKAGKVADVLLLSGDPLDPTSRLVSVWHRGQRVEQGASR